MDPLQTTSLFLERGIVRVRVDMFHDPLRFNRRLKDSSWRKFSHFALHVCASIMFSLCYSFDKYLMLQRILFTHALMIYLLGQLFSIMYFIHKMFHYNQQKILEKIIMWSTLITLNTQKS